MTETAKDQVAVARQARLVLIEEASSLLRWPEEKIARLIDAVFILAADAVRQGITPPEQPKRSDLTDDERRAALIRQMDDRRRGDD